MSEGSPRRRRRLPRPSASGLFARMRGLVGTRRGAALLVVVMGIVAVAAGTILSGADDDPAPTQEAGSRFGAGGKQRAGGTLLDALAPVLAPRRRRRGSDARPPGAKELGRAPADAVAGLFVVGFRGRTPGARFFDVLRDRPYGGVLLARNNYIERSQLARLSQRAQRVAREAGNPAPLVVAAQEGGRLNAFRRLPPRGQVDLGDAGSRSTFANALRAARQLRALGVGVNLAPVADLSVAGGPAQGRGFSDRPAQVARHVRLAVRAYRRAGVAPVVGHFPGEGGASQDPALGPAPVGLAIEELRRLDMKPFAAVARGRAAAPAIQLSNAIYVAYDGVTPATLLREVVRELRGRLKFRGAIVSGDLVAATGTTGGTVGEAAIDALKAGVDVLLVPGDRRQQDQAYFDVIAAVRRGDVKAARVAQALRRIAVLRRLTRGTRTPAPDGRP